MVQVVLEDRPHFLKLDLFLRLKVRNISNFASSNSFGIERRGARARPVPKVWSSSLLCWNEPFTMAHPSEHFPIHKKGQLHFKKLLFDLLQLITLAITFYIVGKW